jgi:hypothetical protein
MSESVECAVIGELLGDGHGSNLATPTDGRLNERAIKCTRGGYVRT